MKNSISSLCTGLQLAGLLFACFRLQAKDFHIAPDGTPAGPGSSSQPYDLATALSGQVSRPGDTFWLHGGDYKLGHVNTSVHGAS